MNLQFGAIRSYYIIGGNPHEQRKKMDQLLGTSDYPTPKVPYTQGADYVGHAFQTQSVEGNLLLQVKEHVDDKYLPTDEALKKAEFVIA